MGTRKTKSGYDIIEILSGRSNVFLLTNRRELVKKDYEARIRV
jgi:hypothetical protein